MTNTPLVNGNRDGDNLMNWRELKLAPRGNLLRNVKGAGDISKEVRDQKEVKISSTSSSNVVTQFA